MSTGTILLLSLNMPNGFRSQMMALLHSIQKLPARIKCHEFEGGSLATLQAEFQQQILTVEPEAVIFGIGAQAMQWAVDWLAWVQREGVFLGCMFAIVEGTDPEILTEIMCLGVTDFLLWPPGKTEFLARMSRYLQPARQKIPRRYRYQLKEFIGENPAFLDEIGKIPKMANTDAGVLIIGESGTGKELCAKALHRLSPRHHKPLVSVNCGAIPENLVENELFGHERGAFTDAGRSQTGLIRESDGGTLFLDEIGNLPLPAQAKLLRFLQEREFRPLGSARVYQADVRVIAGTNAELEMAVREGTFRLDLFYRLHILPLFLPPLRERQDDILLLAKHFLSHYGPKLGKPNLTFSLGARRKLLHFDWPGNVRELAHVVERSIVLSTGATIDQNDIVFSKLGADLESKSFKEAKAQVVGRFEHAYLTMMLRLHMGNISQAAKACKKDRRALWELIRKHGIDPGRFRQDPPQKET